MPIYHEVGCGFDGIAQMDDPDLHTRVPDPYFVRDYDKPSLRGPKCGVRRTDAHHTGLAPHIALARNGRRHDGVVMVVTVAGRSCCFFVPA